MKVKLEVKDETGKFILKQFVGEGEYDGHTVDLCVVLPTMSPLVTYRGKTYSISIHDITKAICAAHEELEDD